MTPNVPSHRAGRYVAGICSGVAGVVAVFVLGTWLTENWMLGAFGPEYVPMAPGTAISILLLSMCALLGPSSHTVRGGAVLSWFAAVFSAALALLTLTVHFSDGAVSFPVWLAPLGWQAGEITAGVMSPLTAAVLLLSAAALVLETPPLHRRHGARQTAALGAVLAGLTSLFVLLGYVFDAPPLYGTRTVPMALLSALSLGLLNVGLLWQAGADVRPISFLLSGASGESATRWTARGPVAAFVFLFSAIALLGGVHLGMQQSNMRRAAQSELEAVADLKTREIDRWRHERLADASFFSRAAFVSRDIARLLSNPGEGQARDDVINWLLLLKSGERYTRVFVFDARGNPLLAIPSGSEQPARALSVLVDETVRKNAIDITDLHDMPEYGLHLDVAVPVHAPDAAPDAAPVAVIVLQVDPRHFLFPLLQSWPSKSATAETLLVCREGDHVVFLNELRHAKDKAGRLRLPLSKTGIPTVMAVQGREGLVEGNDYRGIPVVAVIRPVNDTPWFMVAKVDKTEIYAASRRQALHVMATMTLLILVSGLAIMALWRQRNLEYFRQTLDQERRQAILAQRFEHLMRQANDLILLADEHDRVLEVNDRAVQAYGLGPEELCAARLGALQAGEAAGTHAEQMRRMEANGSVLYETVHRRAGGAAFPVEVSARHVDIGGVAHRLFIVRDITERKAREAEIERLNRLYEALSHVNQAIVRSVDQETMLDRVCETLVEKGGFRIAWVGRCLGNDHSVVPAAARINDGGTVCQLRFSAESSLCGGGAVARAVTEDRPVVCPDLDGQTSPPELRQEAEMLAIRSAAAFPVRLGGAVWGVLAVGVHDETHLGDREIALLEEAAHDVSFALEHLEAEEARRHAEVQLRQAQQRLALALEGARLGLWDWDLHSNAAHFSEGYRRQLGYADDGAFHEAFRHWEDNLHPDDRDATRAAVAAFITERGDYLETEFRLRHRDGSYRWILSRTMLQCGPDGTPDRMSGCHIDITDRKLAEEALRRSEANLALAERIAHVGYWERALHDDSITWSDEAYRVFGLAPQERAMDLSSFMALVHPDDRAAVAEAIRATREEKRPYNVEYRIVRPDGTVRFVHSQGELFSDGMGRPDRVFGTMLDITERRQAEEALRASRENEAMLADMLQKSSQPFAVGHLDGRLDMPNEAMQRLTGFTAEEMARVDWDNGLTPPEWHETESARLAELRRTGVPVRYEKEYLRKDGTRVPVELLVHLVRDEDGAPKYYYAFISDIAERKRAAARLHQAAQRWRGTFDAISDAIFVLDPGGVILQCNRAASVLVHRPAAEIIGQNCHALIHGFEAFSGPSLSETLAGGRRAEEELPYGGRWYAVTVDPIPGVRGEITGAVHVMSDITERKNAENALRESEQRFRMIAENTGDVIWRLDTATRRFTYISPSILRLRGYTPEEIMSRDIRESLTPGSYEKLRRHVLDRIAAYKAGDESVRIMSQEVEQPHRDGSVLTTEVVSTLLRDARGNITEILGVTRDITARKRAEEALRESERRFRVIAENTGDVIWQMDLATMRFTYVSPSVVRLRGYTPEEVMAQPVEASLTPDSLPVMVEGVARFFAEREQGNISLVHTSVVEQPCKDGGIVTTEVVTTVLLDERGDPAGVLGVSRDITERMRAEEALRKSEQRFRATFEDGLFGMGLVSPEGRFLEMNPALCGMLGYSEEEMRGCSFNDITHPDDRAASRAAFESLMSGTAESFELEKRYLDKHGRTVWGLVKTRVLRNPDGSPRLLLAQVQDITSRKQAEQEILANQDRLKRAQAVGHIGSWEYAPHTRRMWASEEAYRILGMAPEGEILSLAALRRCLPGWQEVWRSIAGQMNARGTCDLECVVRPADGTADRTLRVVAELIPGAEEQPARIVGVAEDISERKRTAEVLRETQERLHLALESSGVGTWDWIIAEGKIVWDGNARRLFGLEPDTEVGEGTHFMQALHPDDRERVYAELAHAVQRQSEVDAEFRMAWPDGAVHDISTRGKVYRDASGQAVRMTGICWDITARKQTESILRAYSDNLEIMVGERTRQLREAQDELVRKEKLAVLGQLAGGIGHELRNPLGVISNAIYFLKLVNGDADQTSKEYLNIISSEVYNSQKIISDLLGFARTSQAERSAIALSVLVNEVLMQITPNRDVQVVMDIPDDLPLLSVDTRQVKQVLSNLILNACQAMPGGGTLTIGAQCLGNRICVSVADTGCGMSSEELARIFEPLYSTKARGIGLGLSVTKNLVEANLGEIFVSSEPGRGSVFTVTLPTQE